MSGRVLSFGYFYAPFVLLIGTGILFALKKRFLLRYFWAATLLVLSILQFWSIASSTRLERMDVLNAFILLGLAIVFLVRRPKQPNTNAG